MQVAFGVIEGVLGFLLWRSLPPPFGPVADDLRF